MFKWKVLKSRILTKHSPLEKTHWNFYNLNFWYKTFWVSDCNKLMWSHNSDKYEIHNEIHENSLITKDQNAFMNKLQYSNRNKAGL